VQTNGSALASDAMHSGVECAVVDDASEPMPFPEVRPWGIASVLCIYVPTCCFGM